MPQAPRSPARLAAIVGFALSCFGLLLFLWLSFGGSIPLKPKGYRFQVAFPEATPARRRRPTCAISGVAVGKVVRDRARRRDGQPRRWRRSSCEPRYAPLHSDARAILRQKTLLGETYVELTPGHGDAAAVPEGGRLANARVQRRSSSTRSSTRSTRGRARRSGTGSSDRRRRPQRRGQRPQRRARRRCPASPRDGGEPARGARHREGGAVAAGARHRRRCSPR